MKTIICPECEGKGWNAIYGWHGLPEQEKCEFCDGQKTVEVSDEFAQRIEVAFTESFD